MRSTGITRRRPHSRFRHLRHPAVGGRYAEPASSRGLSGPTWALTLAEGSASVARVAPIAVEAARRTVITIAALIIGTLRKFVNAEIMYDRLTERNEESYKALTEVAAFLEHIPSQPGAAAGEVGGHHVVDVGEIAGLPAVAVNQRALPAAQGLDEERDEGEDEAHARVGIDTGPAPGGGEHLT